MRRKALFAICILALIALLSTLIISNKNKEICPPEKQAKINSVTNQSSEQAGNQTTTKHDLNIIDKPVLLTEYRSKLALDYSQMHYGEQIHTIIPQAIVIHWTASDNWEGVYNYFYGEEATTDREYGKLNLTSHFLVDRDGTIYRLTPEKNLNRHAIGLNWCSIGIENVGGVGGREDLTEAQLKANTELVKYLKDRHSSIKYLLGHYQQDHGKTVGIWKENIPGYYTGKSDPGPVFMQGLINNTRDTGLMTFTP